MNVDKYLPIGTTIANKYEVIDVLGEDDFEILYLVRDVNRKGSFFVLKELFLETFSSREGELVFTQPEALGVFHKRKKQIIEEINAKKSNLNPDEIKIYGYEDENNTIYTLMEFSSDSPLEKYLQFVPNEGEKLPILKELLGEKKKSINLSFLLKILLFLGGILAIAFYVYQFFKTTQIVTSVEKPMPMEHPVLKERVKKQVVPTATPKKEPIIPKVKEEIEIHKPIIPIVMEQKSDKNNTKLLNKELVIQRDDKNITLKSEVIKSEIIEENEEENSSHKNKIVKNNATPLPMNEKSIPQEEESITEILLPHITPPTIKESGESKIKNFLENYIKASASSVNESLKFYDKRVKRYFRFKNASHKTIAKSQKRYNKKWVKRDFKLSKFKIVKRYKRAKVNYFDIKTTTLWTVQNQRGKKKSGQSRGYMTIKKVGESFKITSIRTIK